MTPFDAPGKQAFWKQCGKRRNCSWRVISPFPVVFSTRLDNFLPFSSNLKLSFANSFSLEVWNLSSGNGLTLSQTTNFRLFQTEGVYRRQFWICWKWHKVLQMGRKHCGKGRNCSLRAIYPFPQVFSEDLYCKHV